ncbi:MAG: DUF4157 domain-containing protein [Bacteroidia bacterium]|nr:DUF4157 domain-containing protein [Bacteroidia bacterium]
MKTTVHKDRSALHAASPLFAKKGESSFFTPTHEAEQPFFVPHISRQVNSDYHSSPRKPFFSSKPVIQPKLTINEPGDAYEQEADAMAERVMRKSEGGGYPASSQLTSQLSNSKGSGSPLPKPTLGFMNQAFGSDFSNVRIHTGTQAAEMSQDIQAKAFTHGSDIYFNQGQYSPETSEGKKLLAHELTHVGQQGEEIRRVPTAETIQTFDAQSMEILSHETYNELSAISKRYIREILSLARSRDNADYYTQRLLDLLNTPDAPAEEPAQDDPTEETTDTEGPSTQEMNREEIGAAVSEERSRLFSSEGRLFQDVEERASASPDRHWTRVRGEGGTHFLVDRSNLNNIIVKVKVRLRTTRRNREDIAQIRELEDGIEKASSVQGYTVDLQFVERPGRDVFSVNADTREWADSGNLVGNTQTLAHELHHLLGLDDRYSYIDHATNANMDMGDRIYWFRQEMDRSYSESGSLMENSQTGHMLTDDIANVAHVQEADVIAAQQGLQESIQTARRIAQHRLSVAYLHLNETSPWSDSHRTRALNVAQAVLSPTIQMNNIDWITGIIERMLTVVSGAEILMGPEIGSCSSWNAYVIGNRPPIHLCRRWLNKSQEEQVRTIIHESAHAVGIGEVEGETYEMSFDCSPRNANLLNVADAWTHFVHCISGQTPDVPDSVTETSSPNSSPSTTYRVFFLFDRPNIEERDSDSFQSTATEDGKTNFDTAVEQIENNPSLQIQLIGRASSEGSIAYNLQLSARRSLLVKHSLYSRGVSSHRIANSLYDVPSGCQTLQSGIHYCGEEGATGSSHRVVEIILFNPNSAN